MMPWEKYAAQAAPESAPGTPPWEKYAAQSDTAPESPSIGQKLVGAGETALSAASAIPASIAGAAYGVGSPSPVENTERKPGCKKVRKPGWIYQTN